jgi:hypothetical protein
MAFSSKRGRPRKITSAIRRDLGTEQLQAKRQQNLTIEPFDLLLAKSIISEDEHRAGIHLRWLYTLKNGAPNISAMAMDMQYGRELRCESDSWRARREAEYDAALEVLKANAAVELILDAAVYGVMKYPIKAEFLLRLRDGLQLLCKVFAKKR